MKCMIQSESMTILHRSSILYRYIPRYQLLIHSKIRMIFFMFKMLMKCQSYSSQSTYFGHEYYKCVTFFHISWVKNRLVCEIKLISLSFYILIFPIHDMRFIHFISLYFQFTIWVLHILCPYISNSQYEIYTFYILIFPVHDMRFIHFWRILEMIPK